MYYGYNKIGKVKPQKSDRSSSCRLGIGLEKLDRNLYDPTPCYEPLSELGVKWVRIQSGWCRTEKEKGVYNFTWLDKIVDSLLAHNMEPWMCLCYGNELYTEGAVNLYGAVGRPPIFTEEEKSAWDAYVDACVRRYRNKVSYFEIWNEPDGGHCWRHGVNPGEYATFAIRTSQVIKNANPEAKVIGGSFFTDLTYLYAILEAGLGDYIDYVTFHAYKFDVEKVGPRWICAARAIIRQFSDKIELIQGETGTQSRPSPNGALANGGWTERKQAKFLLRRMMLDLSAGLYFGSYFSSVDIFENIITDSGTKTEAFYGFFGVLGERFDENGVPLGEYYKKESYYAYQSLCAVMNGEETPCDLPLTFFTEYSPTIGREDDNPNGDTSAIYTQGFAWKNGRRALAYWKAAELMTSEYASTISLKAMGMGKDVHLIDLYDGSIYALPDSAVKTNGGITEVRHVPLRDYPLLLVFGDIADLWEGSHETC